MKLFNKSLFSSILFLILLSNFSFANEIKELKGYWFECEFSGKTEPPEDNCKMLDDDGFLFKNNYAVHIKNINSKEKNCKKQRVGQCFLANESSIKIKKGRKDKIIFKNSNLILSFLGCDQLYKLMQKKSYVQAIPNTNKCFWAGKKHFFLKQFSGTIIVD